MKKIITILILALVALQTYLGFVKETNDEVRNLSSLEKTYCDSFQIPEETAINDPEKVTEIVCDVARQYGANVFRNKLLSTDEKNDRFELTKFVMRNSDSRYFDKLSKIRSEWNVKYLDIRMRELSDQVSYFKSTGLYYIERSGTFSYNEFIETLRRELNSNFGTAFDEKDFNSNGAAYNLPTVTPYLYVALEIITAVMIIISIVYFYFRETKDIAVLNQFGTGDLRISLLIQKPFFASYILTMSAGFFVLYVCTGNIQVAFRAITLNLEAFVLLFVFLCIIGTIFSHTSNIHDFMKGKNEDGKVLVLNYIIKTVCVIYMMYVGFNAVSDYMSYIRYKDMYAAWDKVNGYGVFYPMSIGYDVTGEEQNQRDLAINTKLYHYLNARGALLVNSENLIEEKTGTDEELKGYKRSIVVNPNYLEEYPVAGADGKSVSVNEDEKDFILLVPEMYKNRESELLEYYSNLHKANRDVDKQWYGVNNSEIQANQKVRIIWIRDGQNIFTFNSDVAVENGSFVKNVVVEVITESNSYIGERECVYGMGTRDPLKIKLIGDTKETSDSLKRILKQLGLDDNLKHIITAGDEMAEKASTLKGNIRIDIQVLIVLLAVVFAISFQNIAIIFDKNRKNFAVKLINGLRWKDIYGKSLLVELVSVIISVAVYVIAVHDKHQTLYIFSSAIVIMLITLTLFYAGTRMLERKNVVRTLKGD